MSGNSPNVHASDEDSQKTCLRISNSLIFCDFPISLEDFLANFLLNWSFFFVDNLMSDSDSDPGKRKTYEAKPEHRSKKYKQPILDLIGPDRTVCARPMLKELLGPLGWVEAFRDSLNDVHCGFLASVCAPPLKFKFFQETCLDPMQLGPSVGASVRRRVATEISETADFACTQCRASQNPAGNHGIASELVRTAFNTVDVARAEREAALRNTGNFSVCTM